MEWETCFHVKTLGIASSSCFSHLFFFNSPRGFFFFFFPFHAFSCLCGLLVKPTSFSLSLPSCSPPLPSTLAQIHGETFSRNEPLERNNWCVCLVVYFSVDTSADGAPLELQMCLHRLSGLSRAAATPGAQATNGREGSKGDSHQIPIIVVQEFRGLPKESKEETPVRADTKGSSCGAGLCGEGELCRRQGHPRVLYFKRRFWSSLLWEEVSHVKSMTKKQRNSESCSELGVTATSLFLRGKTLPEEEACF